ncbi:hypothetical protein [Microterricola pindariensis]|nr:hypothetical protein [Microterricola pindariensis]
MFSDKLEHHVLGRRRGEPVREHASDLMARDDAAGADEPLAAPLLVVCVAASGHPDRGHLGDPHRTPTEHLQHVLHRAVVNGCCDEVATNAAGGADDGHGMGPSSG